MKYEVTKMVSQTKDDAVRGIVRIPASHIDGSKSDPTKFARRELVTIVNMSNGRRVVRNVVGGNRDYNLVPGQVAIDYEARDALLIRRLDEPVSVEIVRSTLLDRWRYYWNSEDPAMRIANRMGVIIFMMALVSFRHDIMDALVLVPGVIAWVSGLFR
jgi:hypothetical protein